MINYVYYDTWFLWNPSAIFFYTILALVFYLILTSDKEDIRRVSNPRLVGCVPCLVGIIDLGVFCLVSLLMYWLVSLWIDKYKADIKQKIKKVG